jgi:hypothetical protein
LCAGQVENLDPEERKVLQDQMKGANKMQGLLDKAGVRP